MPTSGYGAHGRGDPNATEPIPGGTGWGARWRGPTARGTARPAGSGSGVPTATIGDLLTVSGGLLVLVFSVLPFVSYTDGRFEAVRDRAALATSWNAWSTSTFLAPVSWLAIFSAVTVAALGILRILNRRQPPVLGFELAQLRLVFGVMSFLILLCLGVSEKTVLFGDDRPQATQAGIRVDSTLSLDTGGYLMLLAAFAMLIGAVLTSRGPGGAVVWPLPEALRNRFAQAAGKDQPGDQRRPEPSAAEAAPAPPGYGANPPGGGYGPPPQYGPSQRY